MAATSPLQTRFRRQWDPDSRNAPLPDPGNAPYNCGPTSVAKIVEFYRDVNIHINALRSYAASNLTPTNVSQQKIMMEKAGVPCDIVKFTISSLKQIISSGRRPVLIGLDMSRVPLSVAGHPFRGAHAVVALANTVRNGVSGILIMDPNFNTTHRIDPTNGQRFYSDSIVSYALQGASVQGWGVAPRASKNVSVVPKPPATSTWTKEDDLLNQLLRGAREISQRNATIRARSTPRKVPGYAAGTAHGAAYSSNQNRLVIGWVRGSSLAGSTDWLAVRSAAYGVEFHHKQDVLRLY